MDFTKNGAVLAQLLGDIKAGQLPHTLVIEGKDSASRSQTASFLASALVCECDDKSKLPCGKCTACIKVGARRHPDVTVLGFEDGAQVRVDDIRRIRTDAYATPFEAESKVIIFCEAQMLNVQSQNALLKILEEPPQRVYFILTCPAANMLLPTVNSRCARFSLGTLDSEEIYRSVSAIFKQQSESTRRRCSAVISMLEGFEMTEKNLQQLSQALEICDEFYGSGRFPFASLPAKKEDTDVLKLIFKVLALCALEITEEKKNANGMHGIFDREALSGAAARFSLRSAFSLYELFSEAHDKLCANANLGAVMAYLRAQLSK